MEGFDRLKVSEDAGIVALTKMWETREGTLELANTSPAPRTGSGAYLKLGWVELDGFQYVQSGEAGTVSQRTDIRLSQDDVTYIVGFAVYIPEEAVFSFELRRNGSLQGHIEVYRNSPTEIQYKVGESVVYTNSSIDFPINQWVFFEIEFQKSVANGFVEAFIDGVTCGKYSGDTLTGLDYTNFSMIALKRADSNKSFVCVDDFYIILKDGNGYVERTGPDLNIVSLDVNADLQTEFDRASAGGETANWQIHAAPIESSGSWLEKFGSTGNSFKDIYAVEDLIAPGLIHAIKVFIQPGIDGIDLTAELQDDDGVSVLAVDSLETNRFDVYPHSFLFESSFSGAPWTRTKFGNTTFGFRLDFKTNGELRIYAGLSWLEVFLIDSQIDWFEPAEFKYTLTYHDLDVGSKCFYILHVDGVANEDLGNDPYIHALPDIYQLNEDICRGSYFSLVDFTSWTIKLDRVIDPFTMPETPNWEIFYTPTRLDYEFFPLDYTITPQIPIVFTDVREENIQDNRIRVDAEGVEFKYDIFYRITDGIETPYKIRLLGFIDQQLGFTVPIVPVTFVTGYDIELYSNVRNEISQSYKIAMVVAIEQQVGFTIPVGPVIFVTGYDMQSYNYVRNEISQSYKISMLAIISQPYELNGIIGIGIETPYNLTQAVSIGIVQTYDLTLLNAVESTNLQVWTLMASSTGEVLASDAVYILVDGYKIPVNDVNLEFEEDAFAWSAQALIQDASSFSRLTINKEFVIEFLGESFTFVVDTREISRGSLDSSAIEVLSIVGMSPTIELDLPRAEPYTKSWITATSAKAIVEEVLADVEFRKSLIWEVQDWIIPGSRVSINEGAPISLIKALATAVGAFVSTNKDGDLVITPKFEHFPSEWGPTNKDHTLTDSEHIFQFKESYEAEKFYDSVRIRDVIPSYQDSIVWEADELGNGAVRTGTLTVYLSPFRSSAILKTTGGAILGEASISTEELTEDIEFKDGEGSVSKPIYTLDSVVWYEKDLGSLSFEQFSKTLLASSEIERYSVARITYTSKIKIYPVQYNKNIPIGELIPSQFILEDSSL